MKKIGIDCGASAVKAVVVTDKKITAAKIREHFGSPIKAVREILESLTAANPELLSCPVAFKGACTPDFFPDTAVADDIPAVTEGVRALFPQFGSVIDIGSRSAVYIVSAGENVPPMFSVNEHCAGGTGSFFENQMSRLNMKIEDYSSVVAGAENIPRISGRCAVFAKTDIVHRQQEGADISDILLGLCYAMIRNYKAVIVKSLPVKKPVVLCGGTALNAGVARAVKDVFGLNGGELIIPDNFRYVSALGAALLSEGLPAGQVLEIIEKHSARDVVPRLSPFDLSENVRMSDPECTGVLTEEGAYLGIDIGSTSTDLVLTDVCGKLIDYQYLRTAGNSENAVRRGLKSIAAKFPKINIRGVGVTGSGRERIGKMLGADIIKDEITAQAKAASVICPDADTVFEIGGQDSKFISLKNGLVSDFRMNKICSAGTGSLAEEQAARLGLSLKDFGETALTSKAPADLGERCTVFIESAVSAAASDNVPLSDITAGICFAIVKNYIHKVAQKNLIGEKIVLQGGVAYNPAIVAAFKTYFGGKLTVSPYFSISGAYGVSVLAAENMAGKKSCFKGFDFDGNTENTSADNSNGENKAFYDRAFSALTADYDGKPDPKKKTVGVPLVLVVHKLFPMINAYFKALGFNVLLSSPTNERTIELSQKYAQSEVCYPVKLIYGHMRELAEKKADYIFIPVIRTMKHENSGVKHNYGCVYMQSAAKLIAQNLKLEEQGIKLLSPVFDLDFGKKAIAAAMIQTGTELGFLPPVCMAALVKGSSAVKKYTAASEAMGRELLSSLRPDEKVLVLITRPYDIADPALNMGIPRLLLERGCKLITLEHLPGHSVDISDEYPNLYWPFGQHIITGAKLIKNHPNLYAVYLTNHGCGPDTMLSHLFRREMGDKPYLQIEVDEHYSPVGVITRIEAFLNSISQHKALPVSNDFDIKNVAVRHYDKKEISSETAPLFIPRLGLYSDIIANYIKRAYGKEVRVMPEISEKQIALGRSLTLSKEYVTFTALLGGILDTANKTREHFNVLIPENEGAEADGAFARVIHALLEENGLSEKIGIISPMLENLPENSADFETLVRAILAADIAYSVPRDVRNNFISDNIPTEQELVSLAEKAGKINIAGKILNIAGTPMSIYSLGTKITEELENSGYHLKYQPMTEYLMFMWNDAGAKLGKYQKLISKISAALKGNSSFAENMPVLTTAADADFKDFSGGNGRYRYAKIATAKNCCAVIEIVPRYENTSFIHELSGIKASVPTHRISVDADSGERELAALKSFLYYL
ncbi:MAG: acyl-CoA dehydratase activase [Eubacterium sp.]|nr:acyl-CoA dehydratase activase [Eubacterium sp.]